MSPKVKARPGRLSKILFGDKVVDCGGSELESTEEK
jgi:hypothetical protein